jgi:hypothetical protein
MLRPRAPVPYQAVGFPAGDSGVAPGKALSQDYDGYGSQRHKYNCHQKRCRDRTEQARESQPTPEEKEQSRDGDEQRGRGPCRSDFFEEECPAFQLGLNVLLYLLKPMFSGIYAALKLPGWPMNQRTDPKPQTAESNISHCVPPTFRHALLRQRVVK